MASSHRTDRVSTRRDLGDNPGLVLIAPCPPPPPGAGKHLQPADWLRDSTMFSVHSKPNRQNQTQTRRSGHLPEGESGTSLTVLEHITTFLSDHSIRRLKSRNFSHKMLRFSTLGAALENLGPRRIPQPIKRNNAPFREEASASMLCFAGRENGTRIWLCNEKHKAK